WDDDNTAVCPHCGIDSIIGGSSGVRITEMFLSEMHKRWF
ncbi:cytoplasmic protein, partial [Bacillus thuringiensis]|nr:cytoplasmic protein [Bacillus thuringiensis]